MSHWRTRLACVAALLLVPALAAGQADRKPKESQPVPAPARDAAEPRAEIRQAQVADLKVARGQKSEAVVIDWTGDDLRVLHPAWVEVHEDRAVKPRDSRFKSAVSLQLSGTEDGRAEVYVVTTAVGPDGKARFLDPVRIRVTVGGGAPVKPDPKGDKPADPAGGVKTAARLYVIVVEETSAPAGQGSLGGPAREALGRWQREKPDTRTFWPIDKDLRDEFNRPVGGTYGHAIQQAVGKRLPYAVVYDHTDPGRLRVLGGETLTADPAAAVSAVGKYQK